jgi:Kef-type K+ transport system membrane component KefB
VRAGHLNWRSIYYKGLEWSCGPGLTCALLINKRWYGLANLGQSEAVLPAYLVGMALAPFFMVQKDLQLRMRAICFAFLTPFYFLKAGFSIDAHTLITGAGLIVVFLALKMVTKFAGVLPLTLISSLTSARACTQPS